MNIPLPTDDHETDRLQSTNHQKSQILPIPLSSKPRESKFLERMTPNDTPHLSNQKDSNNRKSKTVVLKKSLTMIKTETRLPRSPSHTNPLMGGDDGPVVTISQSVLGNYIEKRGVGNAFKVICMEIVGKKIPKDRVLKYTAARLKEFGEVFESVSAISHPKISC